jgi:hypothetical protein
VFKVSYDLLADPSTGSGRFGVTVLIVMLLATSLVLASICY